MEIIEVSALEYGQVFSNPYHIFASASFNELNQSKCNAVHYLIFKDTKYRLGIIGGINENSFNSPFSAPFGGFLALRDDIRLQYIDKAIDLLVAWAKHKAYNSINLSLPPALYNKNFITKQINSLYRSGFEISKLDLNYSFCLKYFDNDYENFLWYNAKKNLRISLTKNLSFSICNTVEEKRQAYEIIQENRELKGFLLRMTWKQIEDTTSIVPADFFFVSDENKRRIASAIIFHINADVVQVIYWGDLPDFSENKTMNFLSYKVFEYYKLKGKFITDIGPSSENSIPNFGLCEFKESIGCEISTKHTLIKQINYTDI